MQGPTTRRRDVLIPYGTGVRTSRTRQFIPAPVGQERIVENPVTRKEWVPFKGTQVTVSEGHPFHSRKKGDVGDIGGDFYTERTYMEGNFHSTARHEMAPGLNKNGIEYSGPMTPLSPSTLQGSIPGAYKSTNAQLDARGATAVANSKPTNSVADASVFLGELMKDGIPSLVGSSLWKDRTKAAQKAGSEYLNAEFGWRPLLNDVRKFAYAVNHASAVLKQYERDAGKVVRRRFYFPVQRDVQWFNEGSTRAYIDPGDSELVDLAVPTGALMRKVETYRRQWFSGAFTYHLPSGYDSRQAMDRHALKAKKLFGLTLTPDTLWNLAPWSWAADWFSNAGDVVSNISDWATDGLVMRYGYIMEHSRVSHTYTLSPTGLQGSPKAAPSVTLVRETKIRRRANPFGFGLTYDGLSTRQKAIMLALGLSRS